MEPSYKDLLFKVLSIIDYSDKEKFIEEFDRMNHLEAMANIYETLPGHVQTRFIADADDPEKVKKYIQRDEYITEITTVTVKAFSKFLDHMKPVLTQSQREKINQLFPQS
jgi:adenylosuccinate synthase